MLTDICAEMGGLMDPKNARGWVYYFLISYSLAWLVYGKAVTIQWSRSSLIKYIKVKHWSDKCTLNTIACTGQLKVNESTGCWLSAII